MHAPVDSTQANPTADLAWPTASTAQITQPVLRAKVDTRSIATNASPLVPILLFLSPTLPLHRLHA